MKYKYKVRGDPEPRPERKPRTNQVEAEPFNLESGTGLPSQPGLWLKSLAFESQSNYYDELGSDIDDIYDPSLDFDCDIAEDIGEIGEIGEAGDFGW